MKTIGKTYQNWIAAAYWEFACFGPDFSLKALSEKTSLPRATLYYHFDSKESLINELLRHHELKSKAYFTEIKYNVKYLIPDLYEVMFKYKKEVLFHRQLLKNSHIESFYCLYRDVNNTSLNILLPHIKAIFESKGSDSDLIEFYHTLTDAWYTRLKTNELSVDTMISLAVEIMENTMGLYKGKILQKSI
jgi:AcrR family transcriptional regulator